MKVIFIKDVKGQGKTGDIKEVKDGYAKNYLFKCGYAVPLTEKSMDRLKEENKEKEAKENAIIKSCQKTKESLEASKLVFKVKTGEKDKVFGSISTKQISDELKKKGYEIDKKKIIIDNPIASLGIHNVKINLHKQVEVNLKVELVKE